MYGSARDLSHSSMYDDCDRDLASNIIYDNYASDTDHSSDRDLAIQETIINLEFRLAKVEKELQYLSQRSTPTYNPMQASYYPFHHFHQPNFNSPPLCATPGQSATTAPSIHNTPTKRTSISTKSPLPITQSTTDCLPSHEIDQSKLITVETVMAKYPNMRGESKAGRLACKVVKWQRRLCLAQT